MQIQVIAAILKGEARFTFLQWGRQAGKTEMICYLLWAWGRLNPGSQSHYFAPLLKQAKSVLWTSRRIQTFGPRDWIRGDPNKSEMLIEWANAEDGHIQLHGADNYDSKRGLVIKRGIIILDEVREFKEGFWDAVQPLTLKFQCPVIAISTPPASLVHPEDPSKPNQYVRLRERAKTSRNGLYSKAPTSINPHIPPEELARIRQEYIDAGDLTTWLREYEAEDVEGGANKIFPMLSAHKHIWPADYIRQEVENDQSNLEYWAIFDPGNRAAFAVLFLAWARETGEIFLLDEIYERDQALNSTSQIFPRAQRIMTEWANPWEWRTLYDEAALWFATEVRNSFNENLMPTRKATHRKEFGEPRPGVSLLKSLILKDKVFFSERCKYAFWEMQSYGFDDNGKLPKKNDHLIDCLCYFLLESGLVESGNGSRRRLSQGAVQSYTAYDISTGEFEDAYARFIDGPIFE
jgi:hypothetical protein